MWTIKHIFDGDFGCEESDCDELKVSVTLENENGETCIRNVSDSWLRDNKLDVGDLWPTAE